MCDLSVRHTHAPSAAIATSAQMAAVTVPLPAINPITDGRMMPPAPLATDIRPTAVPELPSEFDAARALIVHQVGPYEKPTSPLTMTADEGLFTNVSSAMKIAADSRGYWSSAVNECGENTDG